MAVTKKTTPTPAAKALPKPEPGKTSTEVATQPRGSVPALASDMLLEDAGAGTEAMGREDYAIPRLTILQDLSPQTKKNKDEYIDGAGPGMIHNSVTNELTLGEEGILIALVSYRRSLIEWVPRKKGGGFVADHGLDTKLMESCQRDEDTGAFVLPNGNELLNTAEYFAFQVNESNGMFERALISMSKTQLKKSKQLNTRISQLMIPRPNGPGVFNPAMFYMLYKFTTVPESNDKGSWFGWKIEPYRPLLEILNGERIYLEAREFKKAIGAGEVKVSSPVATADGGGAPPADDSAPM